MRFLLLTSILFSLCAVSTDAQKKRPVKIEPPSRVFTVKGDPSGKPAPPPSPIASEPKNTGTIFEKYVSNYDLNADGTASETRETQKRCANEICVKTAGSFKLIYNAKLQKARVLEAYLLKADGTKVQVPSTGIVDQPTEQAEAALGFSSLRELDIKFDSGLKIGDAVYYKYEVVTIGATFEGKLDGLELFPVLFEWKSIEINISAPVSFPVFFDQGSFEGGKIGDENGRTKWQFRKKDISIIDVEPGLQSVIEISPNFAFTAFRNMEELGSAFWGVFKAKAVVTPEIQSLANEITKDASNPSEQAAAIYSWVNKNIRYLSIILDRGGWVPHSSTEIINNGYGDCKDYVIILNTLLKAKGIESVPVLINASPGDWFPSVATAEYFNHVIIYIPSLKLFADATAPNTRLGLISQQLVGKRAVLAGERTGVIDIPKDDPNGNQLISELSLDFANNGNVKGHSKNFYAGRSEIIFRPTFGNLRNLSKSDDFVKMMLAYQGVQGYGRIINVSDPHKVGEPFLVELEANIDNYTTFLPKGRLELPVGMNMMTLSSLGMFTTTESRKSYLPVGATKFQEKISVNLPRTVQVSSPPERVSFANAVGSFNTSAELIDGGFRVTREFVINKDTIEPKEYPLFKELVQKMIDSSTVEVAYSADPSLLREKSKELRVASAKPKPPQSFNDLLKESFLNFDSPKPLKPAEVIALEKKLLANANDVDARIALTRHYSAASEKKPALEASHVRHRMWLIKNHPEIGDDKIYGFAMPDATDSSREQMKLAWLEQVEASKLSASVRFNAIKFLEGDDPDAAEKLIADGAKLDPSNYKFPLYMTEFKSGQLDEDDRPEKKLADYKSIVEYGKTALILIKRERSAERDSDRRDLLKRLCSAAIEAGDFELARSSAQELVLDFGQSAESSAYEETAHVANVTLGLVELRKGNVEKSKEYLLTAIRAPLRGEHRSLYSVDTRLAKALYEKGEKTTVSEYLQLCLKLGNFVSDPVDYADEIYALKLWIGQIEKGTTPNFDFDSEESQAPAPKGNSIRPDVKVFKAHE